MSINLWKTGGMATSYNTLPSGLITLNLKYGCDLQVKFKAKSPTGKKLKVWVSGQPSNTDMVTLTSDFKDYVISKPAPNYQLQFYFSEENQLANDIIITDIQLVQKPLPKLTINGIDGFKSGKWTNQGSVIVTDDETLVLNATASNQGSLLKIPCEPSTQYYFKGEGNYYVQSLNSASAWLVDHLANKSEGGFTTHASAKFIQIILWNSSAGQFTFKRPQLNLGTIPAPYEKKRGDKMVLPIAKGNLFDGALNSDYSINGTTGNLLTTTGWSATPNYMPCKPSVTYTITKTAYSYVYYYDSAKTFLGTGTRSDLGTGTKSFTTPLNAYYMRFNINSLTETQIQLNEGTTAQPYKPYAVQMNKKPLRYVPKKNLFNTSVSAWKQANINGSTGAIGVSTTRVTHFDNSYFPSVKPNTVYTANINNLTSDVYMREIYAYDFNKNYIGVVSGTNSSRQQTFTTPSNCYYIATQLLVSGDIRTVDVSEVTKGIQLEEGTTSTVYEPYTQVLPRTKTGLSFNGVTDYLTFNNAIIDEVEFEINPNFVNSLQSHIHTKDSMGGNLNGYMDVAGKPYFYTTNTDESRTSITSSVSLVKGVRVKIKYSFVNGRRIFVNDVEAAYDNKQSKPIYLGSFGIGAINSCFSGTLYKITGYLAGQVVASYDFTNPSNIVGNTVLNGKAKNLIPNFEDARWSLHANAQVLGKDVLRLITSGSSQGSVINVPVVPGSTYYYSTTGNGRGRIGRGDTNALIIETWGNPNIKTFQVPIGLTSINFQLDNNTTNGTFDFIKPQLYQLDGKEGTLNGTPTAGVKQARRTLYAKR